MEIQDKIVDGTACSQWSHHYWPKPRTPALAVACKTNASNVTRSDSPKFIYRLESRSVRVEISPNGLAAINTCSSAWGSGPSADTVSLGAGLSVQDYSQSK